MHRSLLLARITVTERSRTLAAGSQVRQVWLSPVFLPRPLILPQGKTPQAFWSGILSLVQGGLTRISPGAHVSLILKTIAA